MIVHVFETWIPRLKTAAAITPLIIPIVNQASSQCNTVKFDQDPDGREGKSIVSDSRSTEIMLESVNEKRNLDRDKDRRGCRNIPPGQAIN